MLEVNGVQIMDTQFFHPEIVSGQHHNGPRRVWIRVDGEWYPTHCSTLHKVRREVEANGPGRIVAGTWSEYQA